MRRVGDPASVLQHRLGHEVDEVGEDEHVGPVAGCDSAMSHQPVAQSRVQRGHDDRVLGSDPRADGLPDHLVDVAVVRDVLRIAVVGAERDAVGAELLRERQEVEQVPRHRGLANEEPHAGTEPLSPFLHRQRLVVGLDARRGVGLELLPEDSGGVPVGVLGAFERELRELGRRSCDDAREVHHLREPQHASPPHQGLEVARPERAPWRLERRRGHARRRHEEDVELEP